jgi:hypothetical protein
MIEFKGTYHLISQADPVTVLVQYDGMILHVWHVSEPFHRLTLSDEFQISNRFISRSRSAIKLPNGSCIKTDDQGALEQLSRLRKPTARLSVVMPAQGWIMVLLGSVTIGMVLWCLAG